jgi:hypothetical protein
MSTEAPTTIKYHGQLYRLAATLPSLRPHSHYSAQACATYASFSVSSPSPPQRYNSLAPAAKSSLYLSVTTS